jgi:NADH-quinone oxidoreductase subunit N
VIDTPSVDWLALSPVVAMTAAASVALLLSVVGPAAFRRAAAAIVVLVGFVAAAVLAGVVDDRSPDAELTVAESLSRDRLAALAQLLVAVAGALTVLVSWGERRREHAGEFYALLAAAGGGMAFFAGAANLMTLFLGLEWFSIALYVLCAMDADRETSLEAGLKYLVVGSFGSAMLLFGSALVYGSTGELGFEAIGEAGEAGGFLLVAGLAGVIAGLGFKASAAPFHMWTPDVYEGAPTSVTAFMAAATKVAALVAAFPEQEDLWTVAIAVVAILSLAVGNLAALVQRNVKRLLAYSSVSHAGFMLIGLAAASELGLKALLYYLVPYGAASVGAFAVVAARERELGTPVTLESLAGFGWERPLHGVAMWIFMLAFMGMPLTGGLLGKLYVFAAAWEAGWWWLIVVGVVATAVSLYYYLAVIRAMYMRSGLERQLAPVAGGSPPRDLPLQVGVVLCAIVVVGSFFAVQPLVDWAGDAAAALPL